MLSGGNEPSNAAETSRKVLHVLSASVSFSLAVSGLERANASGHTKKQALDGRAIQWHVWCFLTAEERIKPIARNATGTIFDQTVVGIVSHGFSPRSAEESVTTSIP
jgi:hypothetical protein